MNLKKDRVKPIGYLKLTDTSKTHVSEMIRRETAVDPGGKIPFLISPRIVLLYDPNSSAEDLSDSIDTLKKIILLRRVT